MITVDRRHLMRPPCLTAAVADIADQSLVAILRHPQQVKFTVPNRMAATFVRVHNQAPYRKFRDPGRRKPWVNGSPNGDAKQLPTFVCLVGDMLFNVLKYDVFGDGVVGC